MIDYEQLTNALGELDEDYIEEAIDEVVETNGDVNATMDALQKGMDIVGKYFEDGEYFVGDMICAAEIMGEALKKLEPLMAAAGVEGLGKMIICTVRGDIHDIGKNIVAALLHAGGFEIIDLGVDTDPALIIKTVKEQNIKIVALSGVLTIALEGMRDTIKAFEEAGIRDNISVIVGGMPVSETTFPTTGADYWGSTASETVSICTKLVKA